MGEQADALSERLVGSLIGATEIMNVYLGDRLGLYAPLAEGWLTSSELSDRAGVAERYAREWLEEQAVAGFIDVEDETASAADRRYRLPAEHAQVVLDRDAPTYLAAYARMLVAAAQQLPALMDAYRTGGGVGWAQYGPDMSEGQEFGNRPTFINALAEWFGSVPDVHERLSSGARMADSASTPRSPRSRSRPLPLLRWVTCRTLYGSNAISRATRIARATATCCCWLLPVTRRARIFARSDMKRRSRFTSL